MFKKILVANRGEIACRIIKTAKSMGIRTVAVYSDADSDGLHVKEADEAIFLGEGPLSNNYLNVNAIIDAMRYSEADAVHPGYGFLSENHEFARAVNAAGFIFVGPSADTIELMGQKDSAKQIIKKSGLSTVPGYSAKRQDLTTLERAAKKIGYPLLIKATAGGGGRGMRLVRSAKEFPETLNRVRHEANSIFGNKAVVLERFIPNARHIEVQIFGDCFDNIVHLYERDCSVQRKYQKIVEESPAVGVHQKVKQSLYDSAIKIAELINYVGAGTVEFLLDKSNRFYFMEMNTRLQVEHPVTEAVTGLDIVEWQLRIAAGEKLPLRQHQIQCRGHSFEARIYAESPNNKFLPQIGVITHFVFPKSSNLRVDTAIQKGMHVTRYYDGLLAKLITHADNRKNALKKLVSALEGSHIVGVLTNRTFLQWLLVQQTLANADTHTAWIDNLDCSPSISLGKAKSIDYICAAFLVLNDRKKIKEKKANCSNDPFSPWHHQDGWRILGAAPQVIALSLSKKGEPKQIEAIPHQTGWKLCLNNKNFFVSGRVCDNEIKAEINGKAVNYWVMRGESSIDIIRGKRHYQLTLDTNYSFQSEEKEKDGNVVAPISGLVTEILSAKNNIVQKGVPLLAIEAMKMEHTIPAPFTGKIKSISCVVGHHVEEGASLMVLDVT